MTETFKDSGDRQKFETGAHRDLQVGKGRYDLSPAFARMFVNCVYEVGAIKYASRNWEKGIPISRFLDSAMRHLDKYLAGMRDEPHLSMATWNLMGALWTGAMIKLGLRPETLNDLPNHVGEGKSEPLAPMEYEWLGKFIGKEIK